MIERAMIYDAINAERDYQNTLQNKGVFEDRVHTVGEEVLMINLYASKAAKAWTENYGDKEAIDVVRKIAALCVRCMENHGIVWR